MNIAMSRVGKLVLGLIFLAAGAGGLVYVNVQLVPAAMSKQPAATPSAPPTASEEQPELAASALTAAPSAASSPGAASAPAASASAAAPAGPDAPIPFELTKVILRNANNALKPLAQWLKKNPGESVVLVGHGDPKTRVRDYVEVGRARALAVRRGLIESGVAGARIQVQPVEMQGGQVKGTEQFAGTVQVRLLQGDR